MKRIAILLVMGLALMALVDSAALAEQYTDPSSTFSIEIPKDWTKTDGKNLLDLSTRDDNTSIGISEESRKKTTFDTFAEGFTKSLKAEKRIKVISFNKTEVDGAPAGVWIYTVKVMFFKIKFKHYMIFPKDKDAVYSLMFGSQSKDYDTDVKAMDSLISSWKWIEK